MTGPRPSVSPADNTDANPEASPHTELADVPAGSPSTGLTARVRRSLAPGILARSVLLTVLTLLAAPVVAGVALLGSGLVVGQSLSTSADGALVQVGAITVILFGTSTLALLFGMLAVAFLHTGRYAGQSRLLRWAAATTVGALPRLLVALVGAAAAVVLAVVGWPVLTVALLVLAVVLEVRHLRAPAVGERGRTSPGVRRALLWAIPFLPVLAALAVLVALFPAALSRPGSVRQLVTLAVARVRSQKLALAGLAVTIGTGSALLSWGGVALSTRVQGAATDADSWAFLGGTAVLGVAVLLLVVFSGAALAVLSPAQPPVAPGAAPAPSTDSRFSGFLRLATPLMRRTAIITVLALGATLLVPPTPALAETIAESSAEDQAAADAVPVDAAPADAVPAESAVEAVAGTVDLGTGDPVVAAEAAAPAGSEPAPATGPGASQRAVAVAVGAPTVLTAVLGQGGSLGEDLLVNVTITDPADAAQTVFPGLVEAYAGTTLIATADADNLQWGMYVPTGALQAGDTDLRLVYLPGAGVAYASSETILPVNLDKARTAFRVSAVPAAGSGPIVWGEKHVVTAQISSAADGDFTLEVLDSSGYPQTVIATVPVSIIAGEAEVSIDLTGLFEPGHANYMLRVVANDRFGPGGTEAPGQEITAAPSTLDLSVNPRVSIGESVTLTATVDTGSTARAAAGFVDFTASGYRLAPARVNNGVASVTFTPIRLGTIDLTASYRGDAVFLGSTATPVSIEAVTTYPSTPTFRWYGALTRDDAHVEIVFPASRGLGTPTGLITIVDQGNKVVGQGSLVDGVFDAPVQLREGTSTYRALYPGDDWYQPYTVYLPDQTLDPYKPVVTVTSTDAAPLEGETFTLNVSVTEVPRGLIKSVTVRESTDGHTGAITLNADGAGSLAVTRTWARLNSFTVTVVYVDAAKLPDTVSAPVLVDVQNALLPDIRLSTSSPTDQLRPGSPIDLVVTALRLPGRTDTGLNAGSVVWIGDKQVVLQPSADGLSGTVQLAAPTRGGPFTLQGRASYGPNNKLVESPVLSLLVLPPDTLLKLTGGNQAIGGFNLVTLTATQSAGYTNPAAAIDVVVQTVLTDLAGTVLSTESKPLRLFRASGSDQFTGSSPVWLAHAGRYRMTVTAVGDGASVGPGSDVLDWQVLPTETMLTVQMAAYAPWGSDHVVGSQVAAAGSTGTLSPPAPTGTVTYRVAVSGVSCTAAVGATCTIPERALTAGANVIHAAYSGDADNTPSFGSGTVTASAQTVSFTGAFSAAPETWLEGQTVTATWQVDRIGRPAAGNVIASIGAASCTAPAATGHCTLTVPINVNRNGPVIVAYAIYFVSTEGESARDSVNGYASPKGCVLQTVHGGTLALISGTPCVHEGAAGFLTGSVVEITANPLAEHDVYDDWVVNGHPQAAVVLRADGSARFRLTVWNHSTISYTQHYQPACFTLTLAPAVIDDFRPGRVRAITRPNCTDPVTPTEAEWAQWRAGTPRYAAGTDVTVVAEYASTDTMRDNGVLLPGLVLTGFTGADARPGNADNATVRMTTDRAVTAEFKVAACSAVQLHRGEGGSITIDSAYRPNNSAALAPATGECTTSNGESGFVPGTRLTLRATPNANTVLESISSVIPSTNSWCSTGIDCGEDATIFDIHLVNSKPNDSHRTRKVVVGGRTIFGATFAEVRCIRVDTVTRSVASIVDGNVPVTDLSIGLTGAAGVTPGCGGRATTTTDVTEGVNLQRTTSAWYLKTGTLSASTTRPTLSHLPKSTSVVRWANSAADAVTASGAGVDSTGKGPTIDLAQVAGDSVTIAATWIGAECRAPVKESPGGRLLVEVVVKGSVVPAGLGACPEGQMAPGDTGFLYAWTTAEFPELVPFFSVSSNTIPGRLDPRLRQSSDGRWYAPDWLQVLDASALRWVDARVEFCAPLGVTATVTGDGRQQGSMGADTMKSVLADDGGCPPGYALPGKKVKLSLTAYGDYWYTLSPESTPLPSLVFDTQGVPTPAVHLSFGVRCQTLNLGERIHLRTEANCPGAAAGSNRFLRGTAVQVEAALGNRDEFRGWTGTQKSNGSTAWVLMSEDRHVQMQFHTVDELEMVGNLVSNFAQRLLGYLVTAATGVMMAELLLVQGVALAVRGAAAGLNALGVKGHVLDSIMYGVDAIEAQLEMVTLLATCLSSWSSGTDTPLTDIPVDPAVAQGINMTSDKITEKLLDSLEKQLEQRGNEALGGMIGAVGQGRALTDAFLTNLSAYTRPAAQGWSNMSGEVGTCLAAGAKSAGWAH